MKSFKAHNMERLDSWHLLEIVVDPAHEGKGIVACRFFAFYQGSTFTGLCGLMMRDGFGRTTPKPVHLEATTSRSLDIYAHFGFEVIAGGSVTKNVISDD